MLTDIVVERWETLKKIPCKVYFSGIPKTLHGQSQWRSYITYISYISCISYISLPSCFHPLTFQYSVFRYNNSQSAKA